MTIDRLLTLMIRPRHERAPTPHQRMRGKPVREQLLERYGLRVDASRPCVEIEGAQLGTAIEACPLATRGK